MDSKVSIFKDLNKTNFNLTIETLEKKIFSMERELTRKRESFELLRINYEGLQEKLLYIENKQSNIIKLLELGLEQLSNDQQVRSDTEIFLNIESIKNCEVSCLSKHKQYSVLMILIKYILPMFNFNEIKTSIQKTISNSTIKFKITKNNGEVINKNLLRHNKSQSSFTKLKIMDLPGIHKIKEVKLQNFPMKPSIINI